MAGVRKLETNFEQFLVNQQVQIDYSYLVTALLVAAFLAFLLSELYIKYGTSISNRRKLASSFVLLTTTTTLIIVVVKSSLALSLGLVGALSIIRFRAAIKEPEELVFLFLAISIGLGLGAGQLVTTLIAFVIISFLIWIRYFSIKKQENHNLYLSVSGKSFKIKDIATILNRNCSKVHLNRFDRTSEGFLEASFLVDFESFDKLRKTEEELKKLSKSIAMTYLDKARF